MAAPAVATTTATARHPGGRPSKRTVKNRATVLRALRLGATYRRAAAAAGMGYSTLNEWMVEDSEFEADCRAAEAQMALTALRQIEKAAKSGTWQAAAWLLERRYTEEYGRTIQQQVQSGEVQHRLIIEYVDDWRAPQRAVIDSTDSHAESISTPDGVSNGE